MLGLVKQHKNPFGILQRRRLQPHAHVRGEVCHCFLSCSGHPIARGLQASGPRGSAWCLPGSAVITSSPSSALLAGSGCEEAHVAAVHCRCKFYWAFRIQKLCVFLNAICWRVGCGPALVGSASVRGVLTSRSSCCARSTTRMVGSRNAGSRGVALCTPETSLEAGRGDAVCVSGVEWRCWI